MICKLVSNPSNTSIMGNVEHDTIKKLDKLMSYRPKDAIFKMKNAKGGWDGYVRLLKKSPSLSFPTGFISKVIAVLEADGYEVEITDKSIKPDKIFDWRWSKDAHSLRDYQEIGVQRAFEKRRGIWDFATGTGKMTTAAAFFCRLGNYSIITVNGEEALRDTYGEFKTSIVGADIGTWNKDKKSIGDIVITTIPSLHKAIQSKKGELYKHFLRTVAIIIDEAHMSAAETYYEVMQQSSAYYKIGQTGTPYRTDGRGPKLLACTGPILYSKKTSKAQEEGILNKSRVFFHYSPKPDHMRLNEIASLTHMDLYREAIVNNMPRNRLIAQIASETKGSTVIGVKIIEHGEILAELTGYPFIYSKSPNRAEIQEGLQTGEIRKVVASTILDQSVNIKVLENYINGQGHSPEARQTQRHGRILRINEGKAESYFIDFIDWWDSSTREHSMQRMKFMKKEGHTIEYVGKEPDITEMINDLY